MCDRPASAPASSTSTNRVCTGTRRRPPVDVVVQGTGVDQDDQICYFVTGRLYDHGDLHTYAGPSNP